jgi:hypothetical protein
MRHTTHDIMMCSVIPSFGGEIVENERYVVERRQRRVVRDEDRGATKDGEKRGKRKSGAVTCCVSNVVCLICPIPEAWQGTVNHRESRRMGAHRHTHSHTRSCMHERTHTLTRMGQRILSTTTNPGLVILSG